MQDIGHIEYLQGMMTPLMERYFSTIHIEWQVFFGPLPSTTLFYDEYMS